MTTAYTSLLGLALPVTGELSGTWGDTVNTAITSLLDTAVAGTTSITTDADITLSTTTGASNQARQAIILWNPASGTTTRNITAPAQSKMYVVINASGGTQSIVIRGVGPTTGVTIAKGESATVAWNGSDFVKVSSSGGAITFTDLTVTGNTILGDAAADTLTVNATSTFAAPVNFQGQVKLPSTGRSAAAALTVTNPAFLYGVASTYTDTTSSGTIAAMAPFYGIAAPTLSTSNVTTYSFASTMYIAGAPAAGGSATITNPYALYVNSGANYFAGNTAFASNVTLGDAAADTLTVNSTITSNLIFTDNTYDIGASGATRPRSLYLGSTIVTGGNGTIGGTIFVKGGGSIFGNGTAETAAAAEINLDSGATNKYSDIDFSHGGVGKWRVGTNGGNNLQVYNFTNGTVATFDTSSNVTLLNNLNFGVGKYITWDSNDFYFQTRSASVPAVILMNSASGNYPPRLDFKNSTNTATVISLEASSAGDSYFNTGATLIVGTTTNYTGARLYVENSINTNYSGTIALRYNVSGQTSNYYKGMTGTIPASGGAARGLSIFNYDADGDEGIMFWNGVPGSALWRATLAPAGELTTVGSLGLGRNSRTATTTGDFISSGGGNSSTYNGVAIESNTKSLAAQANTSLPSWILDIGGRAADGSTFNVNTANKFRVAYVAAGGTYYAATDLFSINSTGYATFGVGQIADTTNNGLVQIRGDTSSQFDALTIQNNNNSASGQSVRMRWKTSAGAGAEAPKFGFIDYTAVSNYGEQGRFSIGVAQTYNTTPVPTAYIDGLGLRIKTTSQVETLTVLGNIAYTQSGGNWNKIKSVQHNNVAQNTWYTIDSWGTYEATAFLLMISYEYDAGDGNDRFALFIPTGSTYAGGTTLTRLGGSTDIEIQMSGGTTLQMRQTHVGTATGILRATWIRIDGNV